MATTFDLLTLMVFFGLAALMLHRSASPNPVDKLWHYGPPAVGCALVSYVGNNGHPLIAAGGLVAVVIYIFLVLRPGTHS